LVRDVCETTMSGVTDLIARSPEAKASGFTPRELAELIFAVSDGTLMRDVLLPDSATAAHRRERHLDIMRRLWRLLFSEPAYA
jgi:hypothetical protein